MNMSDEDCLRDCEQYISTHSECKTRLIDLIQCNLTIINGLFSFN